MSVPRGNKHWMNVAGVLGVALAMLAPGLVSAAAGQEAAFDPAGVWPDLSGTWVITTTSMDDPHGPYQTCCTGSGDWVPFTPKYRKIHDDFAHLPEFTVAKNTNNMTNCISPGVPGTLEHPVLFEFLLTPGRVTLITIDGSVRRIWTDGRSAPEDLAPSPQGYSLGHWDHRTLVIRTQAISHRSDLLIAGNIKDTSKTVVVERFTVVDAQHLNLEVTVTDPDIFTRPYVYHRAFMKVPGTFDVGCTANNRDNGVGEVDLTPPE